MTASGGRPAAGPVGKYSIGGGWGHVLARALACCAALVSAARPAWSQDSKPAMAYLSKVFDDAKRTKAVLPVLRAIGDRSLLPVFVALSRSRDRNLRLFATSTLAELGGPGAAEALQERLWGDTAMAIRADALLRLIGMEAVSDKQLVEALKISDEVVQSLAARAMIRRGRGGAGAEALRKLTGSADLTTAGMARLSLLGMGYEKHKVELNRIVKDSKTPDLVLGLLMGQIRGEKIVAAGELAMWLARSQRPVPIRIKAYRAVCEVCPGGCSILHKAIGGSKSTVLRVYLVRAIASCKDGTVQITALAAGKGEVGVLARFELARIHRGAGATEAVDQALALGHPIVIDYVLGRARKDVATNAASSKYYTSALLKFIRSVDDKTTEMGGSHIRAATAATILTELGTPEAVSGLKKILAGRYGAITRAVAAGLLRSKSRAACDLARPLLKSPYQELAVDAALILGRFSDKEAGAQLSQIVRRSKSHRPEIVAMASWYLLKMSGQAGPAAKALAKKIK